MKDQLPLRIPPLLFHLHRNELKIPPLLFKKMKRDFWFVGWPKTVDNIHVNYKRRKGRVKSKFKLLSMKAEEIPVHRQFDVLKKIILKLIENLKQMFKTSWCKTTYNLTQQQ